MSAATLSYGSREPGLGPSLGLSALVHVALIVVLALGVRFQSSPPATVSVELWEAPPPAPRAPAVEQKPAPPPPKPAPEPEPQIKKPEIALPDKPKPKPKPKPEPRPEPKPKPKPKPKAEPPKPDLAFERRLREQAAQEERQLAQMQEERALRELIARQQAAARSKALATWTDKIRAKIRGNIILPRDIAGNPEAIFDVTLLPSGEVLTVRKRKSSGNPGYDEAVERAIMKSSPLPKPDDAALFRRQLELKFRPQDR